MNILLIIADKFFLKNEILQILKESPSFRDVKVDFFQIECE